MCVILLLFIKIGLWTVTKVNGEFFLFIFIIILFFIFHSQRWTYFFAVISLWRLHRCCLVECGEGWREHTWGVASCPSVTFKHNLACRRIRTARTAGEPCLPALLPPPLHPSPRPSGLHGCAEETIRLLATGGSSLWPIRSYTHPRTHWQSAALELTPPFYTLELIGPPDGNCLVL